MTTSPRLQLSTAAPRTKAAARPRRSTNPLVRHIALAVSSTPQTSQPSNQGTYWPSGLAHNEIR